MDPTLLTIGYLTAILIGLTLGLIGGGGSILTVPVLVYLLGVPEELSTAYSLFVVGASALFGSAAYLRQGMVDYRVAFYFGAPSVVTVFMTRAFLLPALPETLLNFDGKQLDKPTAMMLFLSVLMLFSSYKMILSREKAEEGSTPAFSADSIVPLATRGTTVGVVAGLVGAGGGFLIVPALALLAGLPIKRAVAASLTIIAVQSLVGFLGDVFVRTIDWRFLLTFTGFSVAGIFLGNYLSRFVPGRALKPAFGWFVLAMGIYIVGRELLYG